MRIFSKRTLREFWESRKHDSAVAERDLSAWLRVAKGAAWKDFDDLRRSTFRSADMVGNCVVFDVGNNRFRLIGRVNYRAGKLYVLMVMDHAEYDSGAWKTDCNCFKPPPKLEPPKSESLGKPPKKGGKK